MSVLTSRPALRWLVPAGRRARRRRRRRRDRRGHRRGRPVPARRAAPRSCWSTCRPPASTACPAPSSQRADLGLPALPGLAGERQRRPDLARRPARTRCGSGTPGRTRRGSRCSARSARPTSSATAATCGPGPAGRTRPRTGRCRRARPARRRRSPCRRHDPEQVARAALAAIEPSTEVTTDGTAQVAGRDAYELVLAPRDTRLAGRLGPAGDRREGARAAAGRRCTPAAPTSPPIEVAFTQISFARPDAATSSRSTRRRARRSSRRPAPTARPARHRQKPGRTPSAGQDASPATGPDAPWSAPAGPACWSCARRWPPAEAANPDRRPALGRILETPAAGQRRLGQRPAADQHAVQRAAHRRRPAAGRRGRAGSGSYEAAADPAALAD